MVNGVIRQMATHKNAPNSEPSKRPSCEGASTNPCVRERLKLASQGSRTISDREQDARMVAALAMEELANSSPSVDAAVPESKGNILRAVLTGPSKCTGVSTVSTEIPVSGIGENRTLDEVNVNTVTDLDPEHRPTDSKLQCDESIGSRGITRSGSNVKSIKSTTSVPMIEHKLESHPSQRKQHESGKQPGPIASEVKSQQPLSVKATSPNNICVKRQKSKADDATVYVKKQQSMSTQQTHGLVPVNMSTNVRMMSGLGMVLPVQPAIRPFHTGLPVTSQPGLLPFTCASTVGLHKNGNTSSVAKNFVPVVCEKTLMYSNHLPPKKRKVNHIIEGQGVGVNVLGSHSGIDATARSGIEKKASNVQDGQANVSSKKSSKLKHSAGPDAGSTVGEPRVNAQIRFLQELQMVAQQDEDGDLPLHVAVAQEEVCMVDKLLHVMEHANVSVDTYNKLKQTPLHLAIITKQPEVVQRLLLKKASPNNQDRHGNTSFHLAVHYNSIECLELLLNCNSARKDLDARNYDGFTALHMAVQRNNQRMVTVLIDKGADIDMVDGKSGRTALFHAVELNLVHMVEYLLRNEADFSLQNYSGVMPVQAASGRNHKDIVTQLVKSGADACFPSKREDTPQKSGQTSVPNTPTPVQNRETFNTLLSHSIKLLKSGKGVQHEKTVNSTSPEDTKSRDSPWQPESASPNVTSISNEHANVASVSNLQQRTSVIAQMQIPALPQLRTAADSGSGSDGDHSDTLTNNKEQQTQVIQSPKECHRVSPVCRNEGQLSSTPPEPQIPSVFVETESPNNMQTMHKDSKKKAKKPKNKPYARKHPHTVASLLDMVSTPASRDVITNTQEGSRSVVSNATSMSNHPVQFSSSAVTSSSTPLLSNMTTGHTHLVPPMGSFPYGLPGMMLPVSRPAMSSMRLPLPSFGTPAFPMAFPQPTGPGMMNFMGHNNVHLKKKRKSRKKSALISDMEMHYNNTARQQQNHGVTNVAVDNKNRRVNEYQIFQVPAQEIPESSKYLAPSVLPGAKATGRVPVATIHPMVQTLVAENTSPETAGEPEVTSLDVMDLSKKLVGSKSGGRNQEHGDASVLVESVPQVDSSGVLNLSQYSRR